MYGCPCGRRDCGRRSYRRQRLTIRAAPACRSLWRLGFSRSGSREFFDISGNLVPALNGLDFAGNIGGAFLLYVPDIQVLGGSIGVGGDVVGGNSCGHLFATIPKRCVAGIGDPYVEVDWSRFFGTLRPSKYPGALPIAEGLTVALGFGVIVPIGKYNVLDAAQGLNSAATSGTSRRPLPSPI